MLKNKFFLVALFLLTIIVAYLSFFDDSNSSPVTDPNTYRQQIDTARRQKDAFFRSSADSPLADKGSFAGLRYYSPDLTYRLTARLELFADKTQKLVVPMSDGSEEVYDKFAHAVFSLNGTTARLLIVKLGETYSIMFRDATSGKETYGGGRYLELEPSDLADNRVILDFNKAYNPYCAYNPNFACPLPPAENTLTMPIKAGERYVHP